MGLLFRIGALVPFIARWLTVISGWLAERKWGQWLLFYLASALPWMIDKVISFFGVKFVSDNFLVPGLMPLITDQFLALPSDWKAYMGLARVDEALSILVSALVIRVAYSIRIQRTPNAPNWTTTP